MGTASGSGFLHQGPYTGRWVPMTGLCRGPQTESAKPKARRKKKVATEDAEDEVGSLSLLGEPLAAAPCHASRTPSPSNRMLTMHDCCADIVISHSSSIGLAAKVRRWS